MCHKILENSTFYDLLFEIDIKLAEITHKIPCSYCGGKLDRANYKRKPRGIPAEFDHLFLEMFSFCCRNEYCRKRKKAPSVRFLNRFIYVAIFNIIFSEIFIRGKFSEVIHIKFNTVSKQTLYRWKDWWNNAFIISKCFINLKGLITSDLKLLPTSFIDYFFNEYSNESECYSKILQALSNYPNLSG